MIFSQAVLPAEATSPQAQDIAKELVGWCVELVQAKKAAFLARAKGLIEKSLAPLAFEMAIKLIPILLPYVTDKTLTKFGSMTVMDLIQLLMGHMKSRNLPINASFMTFAASYNPPLDQG